MRARLDKFPDDEIRDLAGRVAVEIHQDEVQIVGAKLGKHVGDDANADASRFQQRDELWQRGGLAGAVRGGKPDHRDGHFH